MSEFLFGVFVLYMLRNQTTWTVRTTIMQRDWTMYLQLPSYAVMFFHPKYWLLWTTAHWMAWMRRREAS